ncbi:Nif3-like dinuclear metal center hexameric protein [Salsuginibacillus kocurii]|uniref:Nif3-like dinuclear metal center hexameric protein n=1 Tax=Salsuginibacillus kocurii TaxID=427078 RepID=UPI0003626430|nr:Nif3-like dinuclear metal center hexameric protein [Salsuginibacillus kocurii]
MSKIASGQMIIDQFERFSPRHLALEGDPGGLMIGSLNRPVQKVMITLDVLETVVDEAIEKGVDLIIAHHPLIFSPVSSIDVEKGQGPVIEKCIKHEISVYAAHTNLDITHGGVNDLLSAAIGLENTEVLIPTYEEDLKKVVAFVPQDHVEEVRQALGDAGAGHIGDYSHCTFSTDGTGTFIPGDETNPYIGKQGEMEFVSEKRMETIVPAHLEKEVLRALADAHPYEEPAYDVYPLDIKGETFGLGRVGNLSTQETLADFAARIKEPLGVSQLRMIGPEHGTVQRIAVLGGDGNKYWEDALKSGADVLISGDIKFHTAQDALMAGLYIIDAGHYIEHVMKEGVKKQLQTSLSELNYDTEVFISERSTDPFKII